MDERRGHVMSGNTPVARFDGRRVTPILPNRTPLCFRRGGDIETWLENRAVDEHRTNSRVLKRVLRMRDKSKLASALRVHGATITDNYWVRMDGEDVTWDKVRFSHDYFADVALRCHVDDFTRNFPEDSLTAPTPELTNTGSYEKCWKLIDGQWVMLKDNTPEAMFSEIFMSRLGIAMGLDMAQYYDHNGYTATPDFTEGRYNFEPMSNLTGDDEDYDLSYGTLKALKPGLERQYLDILFMDALCLNPDRHTQNYGILRDPDTGEILSMAPNFDNNLALISRGYAKDGAIPTNPMTGWFHDLLKSQDTGYEYPELPGDKALRAIIADAARGLDIRQDYVLRMVQANYVALAQGAQLERQKRRAQILSGCVSQEETTMDGPSVKY